MQSLLVSLDRGAVLRILDTKDASDQILLVGAPRLSDFLTPSAKQRFEAVRRALDTMGIFNIFLRLI
jgi:histidyl-tRNA synthetase